ncbi:MAG: hypothetical protein JRE43_01730, partial [Deltaproteobacteria bacterium]|nr:hypothetical protein [Deltaproteobacteria bacterium]
MSAGSAAAPSRILLVDGTNSLYRAFFAIPPLRAPDGTPTNAAYGFVNMLMKVIREEAPDRVIVVFDARGPTFRHKLYDAYKANREAQPEDLSVQFPIVRKLVDAYRIPVVSVPDFEADDVIATLVERAPKDAKISIVSTDKDLMQLVSDRVTLLDGVKDRRYGPSEVEARFGVGPDHILDLRSLVGDPSDNIPGVKGIGAKGAAKLIEEWGSLENLIEHRSEISATRARNALESQIEEARLSKRLATLRTDAPIPAELDEAAREDPDRGALRALFEQLGFVRLIDAIDAEGGPAAESRPETAVGVEWVADAAALDALAAELVSLPIVSLICVLGEHAPLSGRVAGLAFALADDRAAYLPIGADAGGLALDDVVERLRGVFEGAGARSWSAIDTKESQIVFGESGLALPTPVFDLGIASQLLDPAGANSLSALAQRELGRAVASWTDLAGRGAKAQPIRELAAEDVANWAAQQVCALRALRGVLADRLENDGLATLCDAVELPLTGVLARMHRTGVRIDEPLLEKLSEEWGLLLEGVEAKIYELAGEPFLISSP